MPNPVSFGLIGAGRWGRVYIRTLLSLADRCRLTHLCTSRPERAGLVPHPVTVLAHWQALVNSACDAVIIATPPSTHAEILEACLEAGKPCIVEKPLCLDVETAERLDRQAQSSRVPVLVNHVHLFDPVYHALKQALNQAGQPIRLILSEGASLGPFRTDTSALWDWGPHDLSLCLDLLGAPPERIAALAGPPGPDGSPESICIRLDFAAGVSAWTHIGRLTSQKRRTLTVFTERRLYHLDDFSHEKLTVSPIAFSGRYDAGIPDVLEHSPVRPISQALPMSSMITYFLDGLAGGDRSRFGTALALAITRILARCEAAMHDNRPVPAFPSR